MRHKLYKSELEIRISHYFQSILLRVNITVKYCQLIETFEKVMAFNKSLFFAFVVCLVKLNECSPIETNCTKVESIDGSVGVECHRSRQATDKFEPTIIQQHVVDLFSRAKRAVNEADEKEVEVAISELFIQNLAVMAQANMSDCMDRVNCEEKCRLIAEEVIQEVAIDEREVQAIKEMPAFVRTFYEAGKTGIELGKTAQCGQCKLMYSKCNQMQYDYTIKTNALYKDLMEKNITLFDDSDPKEEIPQDIAYLHHSMRFLDLANLSRCYARVSCETTCVHVKAEPKSEAPPAKSPLLAEDPHKPESVDIIHEGAVLGYNLAFNGVCDTCATHYADCAPDRYSIAQTSSIIFG